MVAERTRAKGSTTGARELVVRRCDSISLTRGVRLRGRYATSTASRSGDSPLRPPTASRAIAESGPPEPERFSRVSQALQFYLRPVEIARTRGKRTLPPCGRHRHLMRPHCENCPASKTSLSMAPDFPAGPNAVNLADVPGSRDSAPSGTAQQAVIWPDARVTSEVESTALSMRYNTPLLPEARMARPSASKAIAYTVSFAPVQISPAGHRDGCGKHRRLLRPSARAPRAWLASALKAQPALALQRQAEPRAALLRMSACCSAPAA